MNRTEHLLFIVSEECHEIGQRASKAARFGLNEIQPGQELDNASRIVDEYADLLGVMELLGEAGLINISNLQSKIEKKKQKIEHFLAYSAACGTLIENHPERIKST